jgi:hypothetical protein
MIYIDELAEIGRKVGHKIQAGGGGRAGDKLNLQRANLYSTVLQLTGLIKQVEKTLKMPFPTI